MVAVSVFEVVAGTVVLVFILLAFADFIGEILLPPLWAILRLPAVGYRRWMDSRHRGW